MSTHDGTPHTRGSLAAVCGITGHQVGHRVIVTPIDGRVVDGRRVEIYPHPDQSVDCHVVVSDTRARSDATAVFFGPLADCRRRLGTRGALQHATTRARGVRSHVGGPLRTLAHALRHGPVRNTAVHYRISLPGESFTGTFIVHGLPGADGLGTGERFGRQFVPDDLGVPALGGQNGREVRHELVGLTVADGGLTPTRRRATTTMTLADLARELAGLADQYATEDFDALEDLHGPAVYDADGAIVVHRTIEDLCDACDEIHVVDIVGPYGGCLAFCRDTEACRRRQAAQKRFTNSVDDEIRSIDDRVYARRAAAYSSDEYGDVANTDAPADLRELMARLAVLMLGRDGQWPTWWRMPGQPPDREYSLYDEARVVDSGQ